MTTPTDSPEPDLTPKASLPITHAVVLMKLGAGDPQPLAAVEFREDGHMQTKGPVAAYLADFTKAAAEVTARAFCLAVQEEINALTSPKS
jgi:hypothetical protein